MIDSSLFNQKTRKSLDFLEKNDLEKAIDCYKELLNDCPEFIDLYYQRIFQIGRKIQQNEQLFEQFCRIYPQIVQSTSSVIKNRAATTNIYHCSVPKAATTWMKKVLSDPKVLLYSGMLPFPMNFVRDLDTIPSDTIVTGTFAIDFDDFQQMQKPDNYKAFFIMRDPRDLVVSNYFSHRYSHKPIAHIKQAREILETLSFEEGLLHTIKGMRGVFKILSSWIDASEKDSNVILIKYEDLTGQDSLKYFKTLFDHCDIQMPENILSDLINDYSFKKLSSGRKQGEEDKQSHYRKGVHGDWKNYFNQRILSKFKEDTGDLVTRLGYVWEEIESTNNNEINNISLSSSPSKPLASSQPKLEIEQITPQERKIINEHLNKAQDFLNQKEVEEVINCYQELLKIKPSFINIYFKQIFTLALTSVKDETMRDRFYALYPQLIAAVSPFVKSQSSLTNIYHCSVPKAATTWMKGIFADPTITAYSGMLPFPVEFICDRDQIPQNTIVTGTFAINFEEFQQMKKPENYKAFFVMRDPRDLVVSAYFSHKYSHSLSTEHMSETRKLLNNLSEEDGIIQTINNLRGVFQILYSWIDGAKNNGRIRLIKYEDLTGQNSLSYFRNIFNHCDINIPEDTLKQLIDNHSFEKLSRGRKKGQEDHNSHYRKGVHGDWQNYFNEKIRNKFEEVTGNLVTKLGYEWDGEGVLGHAYQSKYYNTTPLKSNNKTETRTQSEVEKYNQLGFNCYQQNQLEAAQQHYQQSAKILQSALGIPYFYLGCINYKQQNLEEALSYFEKVREFNPQLVDIYFYLGNIYLKQDRLTEAVECCEKYAQAKPEHPDIYYYLGLAHFKQNKFDVALTNFQKTLELNPKIADAYYYLGEIYMKKSMISEGLEYHKKYQELKPK